MKIGIESNILKYVFRNCYFINGTAYAGKSTAVRLLAERYGGVMCRENYHEELMHAIDPVLQPNLSYFSLMSGWTEFVSRSPEQYDAWISGCSKEAEELELVLLMRLAEQGKPVFVDTNISLETLREISDYRHVAVMLSPQELSVERFFDRPDREKQFILKKINETPDPAATLANYRDCIALVNSPEHYREYAESGFFTLLRDGSRDIEQTLLCLAKHFRLTED